MFTKLSKAAELPGEILCKIFWWCLFHEPRYVTMRNYSAIFYKSRDPPMVFTHVNRQWRSVALAYSDLWRFGVDEISESNQRELVTIEEVARKSGKKVQLALEFDILRADSEGSWGPRLTMIASQVGPSFPITFLSASFISLPTLRSLPAGLFPFLKEINLMNHITDIPTPAFSRPEAIPIVAFEGIPSLITVTLTRMFLILAGRGLFEMAWSRVRMLKEGIHAFSDPEQDLSEFFVNCLPRCSEMQWLELYIYPNDSGRLGTYPWKGFTPVEMPSITTMRLHEAPQANDRLDREMRVPDFLSRFIFSGIEQLKLDALGRRPRAPKGSHFRKTLEKAFCGAEVERLDINIACSSKDECNNLAHMLRAFPHVSILVLEMPILYAGFFDILTGDLWGGSPGRPNTIRSILPQLRELVFTELCWDYKSLNMTCAGDTANVSWAGAFRPTKFTFRSSKITDFVKQWVEPWGKPPPEGQPFILHTPNMPIEVQRIIAKPEHLGLGFSTFRFVDCRTWCTEEA